MSSSDILFRKYRPKTLDEYVFTDEDTREVFEGFMKPGAMIPNICLYGGSGVGKSSMANVLIEHYKNTGQVNQSDIIRINGSSKNGVGDVRALDDLLKDICMGDYRIVLIEETDRLSKEAQDALKAITEDNLHTTRFIFTVNNFSKMNDILMSRFSCYQFHHVDKYDAMGLIADVLTKEEITCDSEEVFMSHIDQHFPDIRRIMMSIQDGTRVGENGEKRLVHARDVILVGADWEEYWSTFDNVTLSDVENVLIPAISDVSEQNIDVYFDTIVNNAVRFKEHRATSMILLSDYMARERGNQRLHLEAFLWHLATDLAQED